MPVLTKASATLSAAGIATQAQNLFVDATNTEITTSAAGFSYKLRAIPATLKGVVAIRFIAANYSYVADTNYKIDTVAFKTIKVNQSTDELKISGDACVDCHGTGTLGAHDARHSVVFDTDHCNSCHDKSGNHGDTIDNRVHAIHASAKKGDLLILDWSEVTYPGASAPTYTDSTLKTGLTATGAVRCIGCHTSGNVSYKTAVSEYTCIACHAGKTGALDHFLQNGGKKLL